MSILARAHNIVARVRGHAGDKRVSKRQGTLERLPKWINLIPMVIQWGWLSAWYRSVTLPSTINPSITAGGLVGEGKLKYFAAMGPTAAASGLVSRCLGYHWDTTRTGIEFGHGILSASNMAYLIALCGSARRGASREF